MSKSPPEPMREPATHSIQIELEGLITLLAQHLYADPDVFLREMLQNAHDSITKRRELAEERGETRIPPGEIRILIDRDAATIAIVDNGSGLTEDELHEYLATIGRSGTRELRDRIRTTNRTGTIALIGQFGIGLLSAFIVSQRVEVITRAPDNPAYLWQSSGNKDYTVGRTEREQVGTTVVLHLSPRHLRYLDRDVIARIVRTYADFLGVPIFIDEDAQPSNAIHAFWHKPHHDPKQIRDDAKMYWERHFQREWSFEVLPVHETFTYRDAADPENERQGVINGVLGITDRRVPDVNTRGTVDVYISRMFICQGNRDILPPWARFIQGVIECDQLMPNAARDNVMRDQVLARVQDLLGERIIAWLMELSRSRPEHFVHIMQWHSYHVLAMAIQDEHEAFFRSIADLVPLESDRGPQTVPEYLANASAFTDGTTKVVYYIAERGSSNQYHLLCQAKKLQVFDCGGPFAEEFLQRYARTWPEKMHLARLDVAGSEAIFEAVDPDEAERYRSLEAIGLALFRTLDCMPKVDRFLPAEVPAVLTQTLSVSSRNKMQELAEGPMLPESLRTIIGEFIRERQDPMTLHLNANNQTVQKLAARGRALHLDEVSQRALVALYNNALMLAARRLQHTEMLAMFTQYNLVIDTMLTQSERLGKAEQTIQARKTELEEVRAQHRAIDPRTPYVSCYVILPRASPHRSALFRALESVLGDMPYCWRLVRQESNVDHALAWTDVGHKMRQAHAFIADVSYPDPDVMLQVGRMQGLGRPILLLRHAQAPETPAGLQGLSVRVYDGDGDALLDSVRTAVAKLTAFKELGGARYLAPTALANLSGLGLDSCRKLAGACETWDALITADALTLSTRLGIPRKLVEVAQDALVEARARTA